MTPVVPQKDQSKNIKNLTIDTNDKEPEQGNILENLGETEEKILIGKEDSKNNNESTSIQPTPTPSSGSDNSNPLGGFKVPKKKNGTECKQAGSGNEVNAASRIVSTDNTNSVGGTPKVNKNIITNLNKSLKAKQKIINSKEPHPKNSTIISEIINNSPKASSFPNNDSESENNSHGVLGNGISNPSNNLNSSSNINVNEQPSKLNTNKDKNKRIAKQNSTRTDFFAAKLASAVDDVDTSDSDETFVYENNSNDYDNNVPQNPNNRVPLPNDAASINGSIVNAGGITTLNSPPIMEENSDGGNVQAESIHSAHSSKIPTIRSTNNSIAPADINALSDIFKSRPLQQRTGSSYSIPHLPPVIQSNEDRLHHSDITTGKHNTIASNHSPASPYALPSKSPSNQGLAGAERPYNYHRSNSQQANTAAESINEGYNEDGYSYDEVDDTDIIDDDYADDEYYSSNRVNDASQNNTLTGLSHNVNANPNGKEDAGNNNKPNVNSSFTSKGTSKKNFKSSNSSSKLRSTTSKLFDKKGSQPRRYSIIPDDIDIEDFDDELIYYDNNIRFPYNNSNQTNLTNNVNFHDSVPAINHNHRIPHYRSLNLNFLGKRNNNLKNKRYLSTGQPIAPNNNNMVDTPPNTSHTKHLNSDIFPFPYPEPHQKYYCDIDEYDEESPLNGGFQDEEAHFRSPNLRNVSSRSKYPYLSASNGHFLLPRKKSNQTLKSQRVNYIKKFIYTLISISCILSVGFIMGFVLATTKELTNVSINSFENPIVSQDELLFNVIVEAFNPGWFTVSIDQVELDIFAKSGYLPESMDNIDVDLEELEKTNTVETVLLGTVINLESPMIFAGGFFTRELTSESGEIKLLRPGRNLTSLEFDKNRNESEPDNSEKWEIIAKNPFDLIVRGILKYNLPMSKVTKSVVVSKVGYIDPNHDGHQYRDS